MSAIHKNLFLRLRQTLLGSFLPKWQDKPRVFSGPESTLQLAEAISHLPYRKILVVTDKSLYDLGVLDPTLEVLHKADIQTLAYRRSQMTPTEEEVDEGIDRYHAERCDAVLAFGGDSSIAVAKVIALGVANTCKAADCRDDNACRLPAVPLFAVPTVVDTASTSSCTAVIFRDETREKASVTNPSLRPKGMALDPTVMRDPSPQGKARKSDVGAILRHSEYLTRTGSWDEAIGLLTESNRQEEDVRLEAQLVNLRHLAFAKVSKSSIPQASWPTPIRDLFPGVSSIPEIPASELSVELVQSAIQHHGSILVRGMVDPQTAESIRQAIDEAFAGAVAAEDNDAFDPSPWYAHFKSSQGSGYNFGGSREYVRFGDGVHAVDSPRTLFRHLEGLAAAGFDKLLWEYFGERPALSAKKSTLRRTRPNALAGWHQDGAFLGTQTRSLNIWTAFSRCGVDSPSLDVFPRHFDHLVEMGGPDIFDWAVSNDTAARYDLESVVRPVFEPGDALLFDQMTLHRTGVDDTMTETRYAIEMWFFAASTYPHEQIPLCL